MNMTGTLTFIGREVGLVEALRSALGAPHVLASEEEVELRSRTDIPFRQVPDLIVYPSTVAEVQAVLRIAGEGGCPVWVVSQGKNWGYGSASASYPGGITMILERMNRILEVNEELGYAVLEPGVTYKQLHDHLRATRSRLWTDSTGSTMHASVLGNALDKGRGVTPYADHFGALCGMEVILPDGALLATWGPEGINHARATYKWGVGPCLDGLFAQSNLGIVVKAGLWLMPAPEAYDFGVFEYTAGRDRFFAFIDDLRELALAGHLQSRPHLANDFAMACIVSQYPEELRRGGTCLRPEALESWRRRLGVSSWTFGLGVYGSVQEVRLRKRQLKRVLGRYGSLRFLRRWNAPGWQGRAFRTVAAWGLRLQGKSPQLLEGLGDAIELFRGVPTDYFARQAYLMSGREKPSGEIDPPRDRCGFVWIGPLVPFTGGHIARILELVKPLYLKHGFDFFVELIVEGPRTLIALFGLFYQQQNPAQSARALALYEAIRDVAVANGYPPYRASIASTEAALDCNLPLQKALGRIKAALDPDNLLAPGKYGIRPYSTIAGCREPKGSGTPWRTGSI